MPSVALERCGSFFFHKIAALRMAGHQARRMAGKPVFFYYRSMSNNNDFSKRLDIIEQRNSRVESDKAWEISKMRVFIIALMTYVIASIFLISTQLPHPFLNAFVPTIGYVLSMQSLPFIKRLWVKK